MKSALYIEFSAIGAFPEKLISEIISAGWDIWGADMKDGVFSARIPAGAYLYAARSARRHGIRIRAGKRSVPLRYWFRFRNRLGLAAGLCSFFLINLIMGQFVWDISVSGNNVITDSEILAVAGKSGVRIGEALSDIDTQQTEYDALLTIDRLAWLSVEKRGSRIYIKVSERQVTEESLDIDIPCNVVSERAATIISTEVYRGRQLITKGSGVVSGDVIIAGAFDDGGGHNMLVHADGVIIGEYQEKADFFVPFSETVIADTGREIVRNYLCIFGVDIPLFLGEKPEKCGVYYEKRTCDLLGLPLPFRIKEEHLTLHENLSVERSAEDCFNKLYRELEGYKERFLQEVTIMEEDISPIVTDEGIGFNVTLTVRGNIAKKQIISIK